MTHYLQLEDAHSLFDYDVRQNDLIQIMIRKIMPASPPHCSSDDSDKNSGSDKENIEVSNSISGIVSSYW